MSSYPIGQSSPNPSWLFAFRSRSEKRSETRPHRFVLPPSTRARTQAYGVPVIGCSFSLAIHSRVNRLPE